MRYYNATNAAQEIGISYKTILRRIEENKIIATKGEDNQFIIPESEVEKHKRKRLQFVQSAPVKTTTPDHDQSELLGRVADLENRVAELEETMRMLTSHHQTTSEPTQQGKTEVDKSTHSIPQNRIVETKSPTDLPAGTLHSTDFAASLGISKTVFEGMLKNGIRGEQLERTKIPTAPGRFSNWFTPPQQRSAIDLLRRHGKLKG